ncbi:MAG: T9SS type A sorting domain-containing protein, partial [Candidatus Cloacimonetes bacterium]|nr:T9SS type A sorting domain-containing protein [Candidatus Cloacimonadota bacterium]
PTSPAAYTGTINIPEIESDFGEIPAFVFPEYDLAGNPMVVNGLISRGAYQMEGSTSITPDDGLLPLQSKLTGNYPNPFNPETTISFYTVEKGIVRLEIYNIKGQKIKTLTDEFYEAGEHKVVWNGVDENDKAVSSGIYFSRLTGDGFTSVMKMVLMK